MTMTSTINISEVYTQFSKQVFSYLNWKLGNLHDAEEVTNDVFIKIMRLQDNPETAFNDELSAFPTWMFNITKSVLIDFTRTNHQDRFTAVSDFNDREGTPFFQFKGTDNAQKQMERNEVKARIDQAIANLKPAYRQIAELRFEKEMKYEEIAVELNLPEGTVKGMVNRCKKMLTKELADLYKVRKSKKGNVQTEDEDED
jgi:RNA polymerase sigma-70 factor (ECF subfamily)